MEESSPETSSRIRPIVEVGRILDVHDKITWRSLGLVVSGWISTVVTLDPGLYKPDPGSTRARLELIVISH